ncbi:MAG TPA: ABC transporter ATP-binding protein [Candidatus Nanoarchaeia archaeon]|nr:ABC transporter ATP-binding protein [Candidatus Nanoarchaeia archaeon]
MSSSTQLSSLGKRRLFWSRLARLAAPCWPHLGGIVLLSFVGIPLSLLVPLPLKITVDSVIGSNALPHWLAAILPSSAQTSSAGNLSVAAGLLLAIAVLMSLQSLASWLLQTYTGERLVHDFRGQLLWHVQRLTLAFHDRRGSNDTAYRIQHDAPAVQGILIHGVVPMLCAAFSFVAMLVVTARINWQLAAIALILSPVLFLLAQNSSRKVRDGFDEVKELDSSAMRVLNEALTSVRAVKAYGQERYQDDLFRRKSRQRMSEQLRLASIQASFHVLIGMTIALGTAAALVIGVSQVRRGTMTVGELLLVMAYMAQLYEPLRMFSTKIPELQGSLVSAQRAFSLFDEVPELGDSGPTVPTRQVKGSVSFDNVGFEYPGSGRRVLDNVSLAFKPGTRIGIVGPSGSGKSTLVNLLTRFYYPVAGRILLDGVDLRNYKLADLRQQFSIVLQEPVLFSTSVAANIAYAKPDASRNEIIDAAKAANAHEFILRLPQGYDTPIGDNGMRLSGGERQRIAIARAFLKAAPVLILDEPTSAVDIRTEAAIIDALKKLMHGRTAFMIAHRLSTLDDCDQIIVLKDGAVDLVTDNVETARQRVLQYSQPRSMGATMGLVPAFTDMGD